MERSVNLHTARFGLAGLALGVLSLILVLIHFADLLAPADKSSGVVIGEIAAEIRQSAARALAGEPMPAPVPSGPVLSQLFTFASLFVAGGAIMLGGVGLFLREPQRLSILAVGFGVSAIVMQYLLWLALLMAGVILLTCIIQNLDSILGS